MPKIKNWSRNEEREHSNKPYQWNHDTKNQMVYVAPDTGSGWTVSFFKNGNYQGDVKKATTKNAARNKAVKWMKNHPNGV